jgi:hypothetical protein
VPVLDQPALQRVQVAVRQELDPRATRLGDGGRGLHGVVDLVVEQQDVTAADQRRHRREVP